MDNTGDFYSLDMGSIPVRRAKNSRLMLPKSVDNHHDLDYNSIILSCDCSLKICVVKKDASVVKLANTSGLRSDAARLVGSSPTRGTKYVM